MVVSAFDFALICTSMFVNVFVSLRTSINVAQRVLECRYESVRLLICGALDKCQSDIRLWVPLEGSRTVADLRLRAELLLAGSVCPEW